MSFQHHVAISQAAADATLYLATDIPNHTSWIDEWFNDHKLYRRFDWDIHSRPSFDDQYGELIIGFRDPWYAYLFCLTWGASHHTILSNDQIIRLIQNASRDEQKQLST